MSVEQRLVSLENTVGNTVSVNALPTNATIPTAEKIIISNTADNEFDTVPINLFATKEDLNAASISLDDTNLLVAPAVELQDFAERVDSALLTDRGTGVSISYVSSVIIGGTTFSQGAVKAEINSDEGYFYIDYAGAAGVTVASLSSPSTFVYINNAGVLSQQTTEPTREDFTRKIFVMRIAMNTVTQLIIGFEYLNNPIGHYANSMRDIYSFLLSQGVPFKKDQVITGRATDLGFNVSAGSLMEFGGTGDIYNPNTKSFPLIDNVPFFLADRTTFDAGGNTALPKFWDNNGVLTALGSTTLVGHRLYRFSNGNFVMQYGQGNYANIVLARAGVVLEDYVLNPILKNATFFGWWLIESTATNTGGTTLTDFKEYTIGIQGGSSSGLSGALLRGNNLSDLLDVSAAKENLEIQKQSDINASASLTVGSNGIKVFCNPTAAINITVDHLALKTNHENYFVNESAFNVTFVASVANSTILVSPNALILQPNGTAYLIRKGALNKTFLYISNP
tara:strand:- start:149 stop:1675 length:1527 start_codon:yes stop_codon:yes gene_type:complete